MQRRSTAQAVISLIEKLPPPDKKLVMEWLTKSNMPAETKPQVESDEAFWHKVSLQSMNQIWENADEDIWDDIYQQQKENGKLQSV